MIHYWYTMWRKLSCNTNCKLWKISPQRPVARKQIWSLFRTQSHKDVIKIAKSANFSHCLHLHVSQVSQHPKLVTKIAILVRLVWLSERLDSVWRFHEKSLFFENRNVSVNQSQTNIYKSKLSQLCLENKLYLFTSNFLSCSFLLALWSQNWIERLLMTSSLWRMA